MKNYSDDSKRYRMYKMLKNLPRNIKEQFQYDDEAVWSFTDLDIGRNLCRRLLQLPGITTESLITDATASVGGNTITFAEYFDHVTSIELNADRFRMLNANIQLIGNADKITTKQGYAQDEIPAYQDIVFFDPPWGADYKKHSKMTIDIKDPNGNDQPIEDFILSVNTKYFVVKLPQNYDIVHMERAVQSKYKCIYKEWHGKPNSSIVIIFGPI